MPQMAKESLPRGASGRQTLYITGRMKIDQHNIRERQPLRRFAPGA
jgi:hypothetical protein